MHYQTGFSAVFTGARKSHLTPWGCALNDAMSFRCYEWSCKFIRFIRVVLTFLFFDSNHYQFIRYARKNNHTLASGKDFTKSQCKIVIHFTTAILTLYNIMIVQYSYMYVQSVLWSVINYDHSPSFNMFLYTFHYVCLYIASHGPLVIWNKLKLNDIYCYHTNISNIRTISPVQMFPYLLRYTSRDEGENGLCVYR